MKRYSRNRPLVSRTKASQRFFGKTTVRTSSKCVSGGSWLKARAALRQLLLDQDLLLLVVLLQRLVVLVLGELPEGVAQHVGVEVFGSLDPVERLALGQVRGDAAVDGVVEARRAHTDLCVQVGVALWLGAEHGAVAAPHAEPLLGVQQVRQEKRRRLAGLLEPLLVARELLLHGPQQALGVSQVEGLHGVGAGRRLYARARNSALRSAPSGARAELRSVRHGASGDRGLLVLRFGHERGNYSFPFTRRAR